MNLFRMFALHAGYIVRLFENRFITLKLILRPVSCLRFARHCRFQLYLRVLFLQFQNKLCRPQVHLWAMPEINFSTPSPMLRPPGPGAPALCAHN